MGFLSFADRFRNSTRIFCAVSIASTGFALTAFAHTAPAAEDRSEPMERNLTVPERVAAVRARLHEMNQQFGARDNSPAQLAQFVNFPNFPNFPNAFPNFPNAVGVPQMPPRPPGPPGVPSFPNFMNAVFPPR